MQSEPVATIDLHGYNKSEGISLLTSFLDQVTRRNNGDAWVTVVTGSGAHSANGPILRGAVQALFERRQMTYTINKGRGSFTVKANSGFVFIEPEAPTDTKVVVNNYSGEFPPLAEPISRTISKPRTSPSNINPLPSEVAASDANMEASRIEKQKVFRDEKREERILKRILSASLLEAEQEKVEEEKMMSRALSLSMMEKESGDHDLQRALELSQKEVENMEIDEKFQQALAQSRLETCREEEEFLRVLEQSKQEYCEQAGKD